MGPTDGAVVKAWESIGEKDYGLQAPPLHPVPEGASLKDQYYAKKEREAKTSFIDYRDAIWHQDSPVHGFVSGLVGNRMMPDENYSPYEEAEWKQLTEGVWPEYQSHLTSATSAAHALYLKGLLLEKQEDITKLGDLGTWGNVGRLAANLIEPTTLLAGVAGGYAAKGAGIAKVVNSMGRAGRATTGIATGAVANAAFEKVRQANNFENSTAQVLEAGLMGAAFTTPFALAGSLRPKEIQQLSKTAAGERELFRTVQQGDLSDPQVAAKAEHEAASWQARVQEMHQQELELIFPEHSPDGVPHEPIPRAAEAPPVEALESVPHGADELVGELPRENPLTPGDDVFWTSPEGDFGAGQFKKFTRDGKMMVEDADTGVTKVIAREDLSPDSPGWKESMPEGVALASRRVGPIEEKGLSYADADKVTQKVAAKFARSADSLPIRVWASKGDIDVATARRVPDFDNALAFVDRGVIHVIADKHGSTLELEKSLFHEINHLGLQHTIKPEDYVRIMDQIAQKHKDIAIRAEAYLKDMAAEWEGKLSPETQRARSIEEMVAEYAEELRNYNPSQLQRLENKVRFLLADLARALGFRKFGDWIDKAAPHEVVALIDEVLVKSRAGTLGPRKRNADNVPLSRRKLAEEPPVQHTLAASKLRIDTFASLMKTSNDIHRKLTHLLVKDPIGDKGGTAQPMTASEKKWLLNRTEAFPFHRESKEAFRDACKTLKLGFGKSAAFSKDFYSAVSRLARGDESVLTEYAAVAPQLQRSATAMRKVFDSMAEKAKVAGVQGAENLQGGSYVPRMWSHDNIRQAIARLGEEEVVKILADAIQIPGKTGDVEIARKLLKAVMKMEFSQGAQDLQLMARDLTALRAELGDPRYGMHPEEIESVVEVMFNAKEGREADAGNAGHLKFRMQLDENHSVTASDGKAFRVSDLFENDARLLADSYMQSMAGHVAMAERGFAARADFMAAMREAEDFHSANSALTEDAGSFRKEHQLLMDMYDNITGRPMSMQSFNTADRVLGAWRAYTRSAFLGQLGVASAFEMKNAIAMTSARVFWQHSGGFRGFISALRSGRVAGPELAKSIEAMTGAGLERAAAYARQHELTDFTYDRGLSRFENLSNKASHVVDQLSGNAFFTAYTRQLSAAMFIQKHLDFALGKQPLSESAMRRLASQGLDKTHLKETLDDLAHYTKTSPDGKALEIRYEDWSRQNNESYQRFQTVLSREIREAIQDHDIGETPPWIHSTVGKILAELRVFALASHSKQFLKGMSYRDSTTLMQWLYGFTGEMMAYSLQVSANFAHNPEELDKRLSLDKIAAAAVGRMSTLGILPMMLETPYVALTGEKLFGAGTVNTDNRNLLQTPSLMMFQRVRDTGVTGLEALGISSKSPLTREEAQSAFGALPGGNLWVMRNLVDGITSNLPKKESFR